MNNIMKITLYPITAALLLSSASLSSNDEKSETPNKNIVKIHFDKYTPLKKRKFPFSQINSEEIIEKKLNFIDFSKKLEKEDGLKITKINNDEKTENSSDKINEKIISYYFDNTNLTFEKIAEKLKIKDISIIQSVLNEIGIFEKNRKTKNKNFNFELSDNDSEKNSDFDEKEEENISNDYFDSEDFSDYEKETSKKLKGNVKLSATKKKEIVTAYETENEFQKIAINLQIDPTTVSKVLKKAGLVEDKKKTRKVSDEQIEKIRMLFLKKKYKPQDIADELDLEYSVVKSHCDLAPFKHKDLTENEETKAIEYKKNGKTDKFVATKLKCHPHQIQRIYKKYKMKNKIVVKTNKKK